MKWRQPVVAGIGNASGSRPARITKSGYNVGEKFYDAVFKLRVQIPSVETLGYGQIKSIHL
jgi:hypothetical protein